MNKFAVLMMFIILPGCSVNKNIVDTASIRDSRLSKISAQLPVDNGKFTLTRADKSGNDLIQLYILITDKATQVEKSSFLNDFSIALCQSVNNKEYMHLGGKYELVLSSPDAPVIRQFIDANLCSSK